METLLAKLVASFQFVETIVDWGFNNPGPAFFFGAVFWALLNTAVRKSKMKADDIVLDIFVEAIKAGYNAAFKRKLK